MVEETKKETELPEAVTKILEELKVKVDDLKPKEEKVITPSGPTPAEQRASRQKSLGFSDAQMDAYERDALERQGPITEQLGWMRLEKRSDIDTYRKEIEAELGPYRMENRTPEVMEKIYYMIKGRHADSKPPEKKEAPKPTGVERTRVSGGPGYTGTEPNLSATEETRNAEEENKLDDREKFVADKLGISETDYAKSRNVGRGIRDLRVPDSRPVTSLADIELKRLSGKR
jgi:hypothetical protein